MDVLDQVKDLPNRSNFQLTIKGIERAMDYLRTGGKNQYTTVDHLKDVMLALY